MPGDAHLCFEPSAGLLDHIWSGDVRATLFRWSPGRLLAFDIQWAIRLGLGQARWYLFVREAPDGYAQNAVCSFIFFKSRCGLPLDLRLPRSVTRWFLGNFFFRFFSKDTQ